MKRDYEIKCPKCGAPGRVELYETLNAAEEPELRDELMANRLNAVECHGCHFSFRVDKPLLYHDPKRGFMIYWAPDGERDPEIATETFRKLAEELPDAVDLAAGPPPALHLVFARVELVERIFLLEAGLDERMIEYVKYLIYANNVRKIDAATKRILFNAQDSTAENLCFVVQDLASKKLENVLHYGRPAYEALAETFRHNPTTPLHELFPGPYVSARQLALM